MSKNSWTLLFKAGKFYRKAGWTDIALDRYSRTQTMVPNNKEVLIELMDTAKASGNTDLYLSIMERQVGNLLTEPKYYRERASAYIKEGKWSKAIKDLEVCAKPLNFEASGEMYLLELLQFIDSGKSSVKFVERPVIVTSVFKEDQRNLFRKSGETFFKQPRGKGSKKNMARILHKLRYHNDALRILSDVIKQDDDAEAWWLMAKIYQVKGEISEVNPALLSSRQADPTFVPTRLWLARVYLDGEHFEQANFELDAVLKINSRNFEALLLLAELYFEISNREEMNDVLEKLKKLQPDSLELQKLLEKVE
jgi:tetratricopeptide (TPR) repeat protein